MAMTEVRRSHGGARILVVEDDPDSYELVTFVLQQAGHQPVLAKGVREALNAAIHQRFDLILLDWYFEDGTGVQFCKDFRYHDPDTPVFFYSGVAYPPEIRKAMEAGAQQYFIKPVDHDQLLKQIELATRPRGPRSSSAGGQ